MRCCWLLGARWVIVVALLGAFALAVGLPSSALADSTGSITGKCTFADGSPDPAFRPTVYQTTDGGVSWSLVYAVASLPLPDGSYTVGPLPTGKYRVSHQAHSGGNVAWGETFYGGSSDVSTAKDVTVTAGVTTTGIDLRRSPGETIKLDAAEPDNWSGAAVRITVGDGWHERTLGGLPDADWLKFDVVAGHTYTIECTGTPSYPVWGNAGWSLSDTYMSLYDSDAHTQLAFSKDDLIAFTTYYTITSRYSKLSWTAEKTGTLFVRITSDLAVYRATATYGAYRIGVVDTTAAAGTAKISGFVRETGTGLPIAGANVRLWNTVTARVWNVVAAEDGSFHFHGLPAASYGLYSECTGYVATSTVPNPIQLVAGANVTAGLHQDPAVYYPLSGMLFACVQLADGPAAEGAKVSVQGPTNATTSVQSNGYSLIDGLEPGDYRATITFPGYHPIVHEGLHVRTYYGWGPELVETLLPVGTVTGVVRSGGAPLAGVTVTAGEDSAKTAADGHYTIDTALVGSTQLRFSKGGYGTVSQVASVSKGATTTLDAALVQVATAVTVTHLPDVSALTYRRRHGKAKFTLSATLDGEYGCFPGSPIYLQVSANGKSGWKNVVKRRADSNGFAWYTITATKRGKQYYRWYTPATSAHFKGYSKTTKVTIR